MGLGDHRGDHPPAGHGTGLTSQNHPYDQEGNQQGPWNPAHRRDSRAARHDQTLKTAASQ
jgi:hypothetical protein